MASPIIDSHQHFWDPASGGDYGWLSGPFEPLNRKFEPRDLHPALQANGVVGTILVQTWNDLGETWDFIETAANTDFVAGVVGWVDLTDPNVADTLAELQQSPNGKWLVGIRHLIQTEPDPNWLLRDDVRRGLQAVQDAGLVYDLVPNLPQLPSAIETTKTFPELRFVLDHMSKPNIKNREYDEWAELMQGFRRERRHVWCKLSGMVTEADWHDWTPADLKPYVDHVLEIFGPDRCMFGTDWPVCLVAGSYDDVMGALRESLPDLTAQQRDQIFGGSAIEAYKLPAFNHEP
ncbi:amidohydrolase family protein [Phyllobacterium endophyticum]|uniref:amidohydrolase family protein n=1 Tax=Phyllobacterium endophyticum TaxID=1149773 RepID=UPI0011C7E7A4|nr:amidohydrolase family protein [Phyllobacterium endophyticum]TXR47653.1 amidohydrolase family protein [Phyllobacterium endophyticum]